MIGAGQIESGIAQSDIVNWTYAGTGTFAGNGGWAAVDDNGILGKSE